MLAIADAERPVGLAGVMGGAETEVGEATRDVLLERPQFDAMSDPADVEGARALVPPVELPVRDRPLDPEATGMGEPSLGARS